VGLLSKSSPCGGPMRVILACLRAYVFDKLKEAHLGEF